MKRITHILPFTLLTISLTIQPGSLRAQEKEPPAFGISFSGFVKNDFFWDTRQTVAAREGHFLLWPAAFSGDANGNDINAKTNFNFLSVQSRLSGKITGPDAFGAKTSGMIEGDFFAQLNDNINLFRLRHAFLKLSWERTEILTGQYWNPLFVTGCFPGTVSFNTGTPLQSFARNPQFRITHRAGKLSFIAAALSQRDYSSRGPDPDDNSATLISCEFLRNSAIPDIHLQVHYSSSNESSGTAFLAGVGAAYKTLVPRLSSTVLLQSYKVDERVNGLTAVAFTKISTKGITIKLQGRYGENTADILSPGGFAVKSIVDAATGLRSYTPLRNLTAWGEIHTNGKPFQVGIFGGYLKSLGLREARDFNFYDVYGLGTNIASLYRVSPRITYSEGKTTLGFEVEMTSAAFGSDFDENYLPASTRSVTNARILLSTIYRF